MSRICWGETTIRKRKKHQSRNEREQHKVRTIVHSRDNAQKVNGRRDKERINVQHQGNAQNTRSKYKPQA
jgi:hypothetical protein